jgi:AraC-like DNA-binding protein/ligand-binding sensor protein
LIENLEVPQSVKDVKDHYSKATGIPCMILDIHHHHMVDGCNDGLDTLLHLLGPEWKKQSLETHIHSAVLSERFGGSYIYFCLISMLYWVSPVIVHGNMDYAIIAGPVLTIDPSELLEEDLLKDIKDKKEILEFIDTIPKVEISRIHNLSEVLRMCSGWACGYTEHRMVETRKSLELQSRLSESIQDIKHSNKETFHCYPIEKENLLQDAIQWGDRATAISILNNLLGIIFFTSGNSLELISFRVMEIISLLSRAAVKGGVQENIVFEKSIACQKEIRHYSSLEGISLWLSKILHSYLDMVIVSMDVQWDPIIAKVLRYIHSNYKGHLTLDETAHYVALSPNYVSHIFNAKVGISFSTYVNKLRVEHAQKLLLETSLPIVEIVGMVGFEEQSYFTKIFKDITSYSPGRYRKKGGGFPSKNQEHHSS